MAKTPIAQDTAANESTEKVPVGDILVSSDVTANPLINPPIKNKIPIEEVMSKYNLRIDDLIKCGQEGLQAMRMVRDRDGDVIAEDPDMPTRHKYFASFLELLGLMKSATDVRVQVVNISAEERELLDAYKRESGL